MLYIVTGEVGAGKSLWVLKSFILPVLRGKRDSRDSHTGRMRKRRIVTNMVLCPDAMEARGLDVSRIHCFRDPIATDDARQDPGDGDAEWCLEPDGLDKWTDSCIIIDEATTWFPGGKIPDALHVSIDRQRKFGLDIVLICPEAGSLPAALKRKATRFLHVENWEGKRIPNLNLLIAVVGAGVGFTAGGMVGFVIGAAAGWMMGSNIPAPPVRMAKTLTKPHVGGSSSLASCVGMQQFKKDKDVELYDSYGGTYGMPTPECDREGQESARASKKGWHGLLRFAIGGGLLVVMAAGGAARVLAKYSGGEAEAPAAAEAPAELAAGSRLARLDLRGLNEALYPERWRPIEASIEPAIEDPVVEVPVPDGAERVGSWGGRPVYRCVDGSFWHEGVVYGSAASLYSVE